jgi:tRNA(Ile)-lysidine synthase
LAAPVPGFVALPGTATAISLELIEKPETSAAPASVYNSDTGCINWRSLSRPLEIRNWRPGDHYQPVGSTGEAKIKSLFQKARIPRWERRHWPVMTDGSAIVWAGRFGPAVQFAAVPGSSPVLRISERPILESGAERVASKK